MLLTEKDTLFFCEACEGYALVNSNAGKITVVPCGCEEGN